MIAAPFVAVMRVVHCGPGSPGSQCLLPGAAGAMAADQHAQQDPPDNESQRRNNDHVHGVRGAVYIWCTVVRQQATDML